MAGFDLKPAELSSGRDIAGMRTEIANLEARPVPPPAGTNSARPSTRPTSTAAAVAVERAEKGIGGSTPARTRTSAAKMPNTRRPGRERGIDRRPVAGEHPKAYPAGRQILHCGQVGEW